MSSWNPPVHGVDSVGKFEVSDLLKVIRTEIAGPRMLVPGPSCPCWGGRRSCRSLDPGGCCSLSPQSFTAASSALRTRESPGHGPCPGGGLSQEGDRGRAGGLRPGRHGSRPVGEGSFPDDEVSKSPPGREGVHRDAFEDAGCSVGLWKGEQGGVCLRAEAVV